MKSTKKVKKSVTMYICHTYREVEDIEILRAAVLKDGWRLNEDLGGYVKGRTCLSRKELVKLYREADDKMQLLRVSLPNPSDGMANSYPIGARLDCTKEDLDANKEFLKHKKGDTYTIDSFVEVPIDNVDSKDASNQKTEKSPKVKSKKDIEKIKELKKKSGEKFLEEYGKIYGDGDFEHKDGAWYYKGSKSTLREVVSLLKQSL